MNKYDAPRLPAFTEDEYKKWEAGDKTNLTTLQIEAIGKMEETIRVNNLPENKARILKERGVAQDDEFIENLKSKVPWLIEMGPDGARVLKEEEAEERINQDPRFKPEAMEVMEYFNKIVEYHIANNLPTDIRLCLSPQESRRIMDGFRFYDATSSIRGEYSYTTFPYGGFTFTLVHL